MAPEGGTWVEGYRGQEKASDLPEEASEGRDMGVGDLPLREVGTRQRAVAGHYLPLRRRSWMKKNREGDRRVIDP